MLEFALRSAPRKVARYVEQRRRNWKFDRSMRCFTRSLAEGDLCVRLIAELVENWNNTWSAQEEYIAAFLNAARTAPGPILECGSGLSTLLLGAVARQTGNRVWCLEHEPTWFGKVARALRRHAIDSVHLCQASIVSYGAYSWYQPPLDDMPDDFALIICDGPPGTTPGGRYGFLPVMKSHCRSGATILLDDATRPSEQEALERWSTELGTSFAIEGETKPFGRLRLP